jgi:hypothetical protein
MAGLFYFIALAHTHAINTQDNPHRGLEKMTDAMPGLVGHLSTELMSMVQNYDEITHAAYPDVTVRVARKEAIIMDMADFIHEQVPFEYAQYAHQMGLKAGFARALGDYGRPNWMTFRALHKYAAAAGPTDYNLKHQIVRAFRSLKVRFPDNSVIAEHAATALPYLLANADAPLLSVVIAMKTELNIT